MSPSFELIFQYILSISLASGLGLSIIFMPSYVGYRFIKKKLDKKGW